MSAIEKFMTKFRDTSPVKVN